MAQMNNPFMWQQGFFQNGNQGQNLNQGQNRNQGQSRNQGQNRGQNQNLNQGQRRSQNQNRNQYQPQQMQGFFGPQTQGFSRPQMQGFPGQQLQSFPGPQMQGFPGQQNQSAQGQKMQGFPGQQNQSAQGQKMQGFPGQQMQTVPVQQTQGFQGQQFQGFSGPQPQSGPNPQMPNFLNPQMQSFQGRQFQPFPAQQAGNSQKHQGNASSSRQNTGRQEQPGNRQNTGRQEQNGNFRPGNGAFILPGMQTLLDKREKDAEAIKRQKEENSRVLDPSRYKETSISRDDVSRIVALYGNDIENIYDLSPGQMWMFERGHTTRQVQIMQFVCRAKVKFDPASFRQNIYVVRNSHDNLRTAIVYRNMDKPYKVVLRNRNVDYLLIDSEDSLIADDEDSVSRFINRLIAEDHKRGFDLEQDPLLRIHVHRIKDDDYIFLISQPHINTDGSSLGILIKELFIDYALEINGIDMAMEESSYKEYAKHMMTVDKESQLSYWKEKLKDYSNGVLLPGYKQNDGEYAESEYGFSITGDSFKNLLAFQSSLKLTLFNVLEAAWLVTLSQITGSKDMVFGTIISGRSAEVEGSMNILGGFAEMVPVRVRINESDTFSRIAESVREATTEAEKNSDCTIREIEECIGRKTPLVTHDLNFHNFNMPKVDMFKNGALKGFELMSGSMHISHMENLSIIFSRSDNELTCNFHYNLNSYLPYTIMITATHFRNILRTIAIGNRDLKLSDFPEPDREMFDVGRDSYRLTTMRKVLILRANELFEDLSDEELSRIAEKSRIVGYMGGTMLFDPEEKLTEIPFVAQGRVNIQSGSTDEWRKVSEVLTGNSIISCTALTEEKIGVIATVESHNTEILFIPRDVFLEFLNEHSGLYLKLPVVMEKQRRNNENQLKKS